MGNKFKYEAVKIETETASTQAKKKVAISAHSRIQVAIFVRWFTEAVGNSVVEDRAGNHGMEEEGNKKEASYRFSPSHLSSLQV